MYVLVWYKATVHFRPVTENRHMSNMYVANDAFTLRLEVQKQLQQERRQEIEDRIKARNEAAEEITLSAAVKKKERGKLNKWIEKLIARSTA